MICHNFSTVLQAREKFDEQGKFLEQLKSTNARLENQNKHLLRNISVLFATAKHEISRKDKQIRELQERYCVLFTSYL